METVFIYPSDDLKVVQPKDFENKFSDAWSIDKQVYSFARILDRLFGQGVIYCLADYIAKELGVDNKLVRKVISDFIDEKIFIKPE